MGSLTQFFYIDFIYNVLPRKYLSPQVEWYHEDSSQSIAIAGTIQIQQNPIMGGLKKFEVRVRRNGDRQTHMLIIRRLRQQDAGTYICKIRVVGVSENKWNKKKGSLTVQGMCKIINLHI